MGRRRIRSLKTRVGRECNIGRRRARLHSGGIHVGGVREGSHSAASEDTATYFPLISIEEFDWIRKPFVDLSVINHYNFKLCEEEELAILSGDRTLKLNYAQPPLDAF